MNDHDISQVFAAHVPRWVTSGERVLLVVPDTTRTAPLARLLGLLLPVLREAGAETTILVALGTHPPLPEAVLRTHLGPAAFAAGVRVLNHAWDNPEAVMSVGTLSAAEVSELSGGLLAEAVDLRVNRAIRDADRLLFLHPVFPHELVGFSGGSKYLFPGISGPEMIDIIHWLGALCGSGTVIGQIDTPIRRVLDAAAAKMPLPMHGLSFVCHGGEVVALEAGDLCDAWRRAAAVSQRVHVTRLPRPFRTVLACCPPMYPDLWTGGKCMYKCEGAVADGGELIIYAPHVTTFSESHAATVERVGYHVRDYFLAHWERYRHESRAVLAYLAIVKGAGTYVNGAESTRIRVSVASQIPAAKCLAAGIGYVDPATLDVNQWKTRPGVWVIAKAGETLYTVGGNDDPQPAQGLAQTWG